MEKSLEFNNQIGLRLKAEMKNRDINASELARRSGVLTSFLYDVISGKSANPSTIKLAKVADALGINLSVLVDGENNPCANYSASPPIPLKYIAIDKGVISSYYEYNAKHSFCKDWLKQNFTANAEDLRLLYINSDTMQPSILLDDLVIIDTKQTTPSKGIFIILDGNSFRSKIYEEHSQTNDIIIGKIVWLSRKL